MKRSKKFFSVLLAIMVLSIGGCTKKTNNADEGTASRGSKMYIEIVSKGFQHQFWQSVLMGANNAAKDLDVTIHFDGPQTESDISGQVNMLNAAIAKKPAALGLAALNSEAVTGQLIQARDSGIPIIGFDSGVVDPPEGAIKANAATDNYNAAAIGSVEMMKLPEFKEKVRKATAINPVVIACLPNDATAYNIIQRTSGFVDKMRILAEELHPDAVEVTGHTIYEKKAAKSPAVIIRVSIPPTSDPVDAKNAAQAVLNDKRLIGISFVGSASMTGLLAATNDGSDFAPNGRYNYVKVSGFDAGAAQKNAVRNGWFFGAVSQDPYQIGYQCVVLAVKAAKGEAVSDIDTGAKWYTAANMDDLDIAPLLYD
jgi:ribose transport system substrate-binding protein